MEREGGEAGLEGSAADRGTGGDGSIPSMSTKGCTRELTGLTHDTEEGGNSTTGMNEKGEVENGGLAAQLVKRRTKGSVSCRLSHSQPILQSGVVLSYSQTFIYPIKGMKLISQHSVSC